MSSSWGLLDEKDEQEFHKRRLLNVEEKPFKRITKRLGSVNTILKTASIPPPQPSQDGNQPESPTRPDAQSQLREIDQLREDLTLDFAAFNHSIARLQFLSDANKRERHGYEEKRQRILDECQAVRDRNNELRLRLDDARATLSQRKRFDELAEKITNNKLLRPREDQLASLAKLEDECKELERESETYSATWNERRDQFARIMEEGMLLRRQIRDEKEEVDRREGMNEDGEEDGEASRGGQTPGHIPSGNATPHPENGTVPRDGDGSGTPMRTNGSRTPRAESPSGDGPEGLKPRPGALGSLSQFGSRAGSRAATPQPLSARDDIEEGEDVEMSDDGKPNGAPQITVDGPGDTMEVDGE